MTESVDRRILGAFVCVDAITATTIVPAIPVVADPGWTVIPNHSGVYVIFDGPGMNSLTGQFIPTGTWQPDVQFQVTLQDPNLAYLPRRASLSVPFAVPANPAVPTTPTDVFIPQQITVYPSPSAAVGPNWAVIRASVTQSGTTTTTPLPWAYLRVVQSSNNQVLASGLTYTNGEALLAVIGLTVQPTTSGTGPVTTSVTPATVTAYFDPTILSQPSGWIPNPDNISTNLSNLKSSGPQTVQLSSGEEFPMSFQISL